MKIEEIIYIAIICVFMLMPLPAILEMFFYWLWGQHLDKRGRQEIGHLGL